MRLTCLVAFFLALWTVDGCAHRTDGPRDQSGIPIAAISHGEMAIISRHRGDIFALAERSRAANRDFLTIARYARLQYADCLWGLVPLSISDELSPFNECSHAYLAAAKELLLRMRAMPDVAARAGDITSRISYEAALEGEAFIGCAYSGEGFNTATLVRPQWHDVPLHVPTMLTLLCAFGLLPFSTFVLSRLRGWRRWGEGQPAE